jgi:hypothetical protein
MQPTAETRIRRLRGTRGHVPAAQRREPVPSVTLERAQALGAVADAEVHAEIGRAATGGTSVQIKIPDRYAESFRSPRGTAPAASLSSSSPAPHASRQTIGPIV